MADIEDGEITEEDFEAADESISRGDTIDESKLLKNILEYAAANDITVSQEMLPLILIEELKIRVTEIENKLREVKSRITFSGVKGGLGGEIHSYLSGLDYVSAGHTGFQAALTFPLSANLGGTGIANLAASTLTLGAATTITGGGTLALGGFTGGVPATGTFAMGAGTLTSATINDVTGATHTHAITVSPTLLGNGAMQYQTIITGANPFIPVYSGFLLDGTTGGKTVFAVTNTKTLTLTSTGDFNLTVPATGTAALLATENIFTVKQLVQYTRTAAGAAANYGIRSLYTAAPAADDATTISSGQFDMYSGGTKNITIMYGVLGTAYSQGTGLITTMDGTKFTIGCLAAGNVTNAHCVRVSTYGTGAGSLINLYGLSVGNLGAYNTPTNMFGIDIDANTGAVGTAKYGLRIGSVSGAATTNYAIYTNVGLNLFGDQLSIVGSADRIQLQVKANATQTTNLQTWENSAGTVLGYVSGAGYLNLSQTVNQSITPSVTASQAAQTLQDGSAFTATDATMATMYQAVKFTASAAHTMGDFQIRIKESADITNTTATLTGYIYSDDGFATSKPLALLATGLSIRFGTITTTYQLLSVGTTYTMVNGTAYWLVLKWSATPVGGNIVLDSAVSANQGATSPDGTTWTNTNVQLYHIIRGRTSQGVYGTSKNNYGAYGTSENETGVYGFSINNYGVFGQSTNNVGLRGYSANNTGVQAISLNSTAVSASSTAGIGVSGTSSSTYGVQGISASSWAVYGASVSSVGGVFETNPTSTNTVAEVLRLRRTTSLTAADNIGGSIDSYIEDASGNANLAGRIATILTTATHASEVSAMAFWVDNAGAGISEVFRIQGDTGFIFNDGGLAALDFRVESDTDANMLYLDSGNNSITFGSTTELAKVGIDGNADEVQFKVQAHSTQNQNILEIETSGSVDLITVDPSGNLYLATTQMLQFRDAAVYINSNDDGHLDLTADTSIDLNGAVNVSGNVKLDTAGNGLYVKEGANCTQGVATLVAGTVTVSTTKVTANSRIFLTPQSLGTILRPTGLGVTARVAGTSFTITSMDITDTSTVGWLIMEPA